MSRFDGTPALLDDGTWGVQLAGPAAPGQTITVDQGGATPGRAVIIDVLEVQGDDHGTSRTLARTVPA